MYQVAYIHSLCIYIVQCMYRSYIHVHTMYILGLPLSCELFLILPSLWMCLMRTPLTWADKPAIPGKLFQACYIKYKKMCMCIARYIIKVVVQEEKKGRKPGPHPPHPPHPYKVKTNKLHVPSFCGLKIFYC